MGWWEGDPEERFWMESTDRNDLGANLIAPFSAASPGSSWRYNLLLRARPGDVVLHYHKRRYGGAICAYSRIAGPPTEQFFEWKARGTSARRRGDVLEEKLSYVLPLVDFTEIEPITLEEIRARRADILPIIQEIRSRKAGVPYFGFDLGDRVNPAQGYAFKIPAAFIELFPSLLAMRLDSAGDDLDWVDTLPLGIEGYEGARRARWHVSRERDRKLSQAKKNTAKAAGSLKCEICDYRPPAHYGDYGERTIEVHHLTPLHLLDDATVTTLDELALLCANCHRVVHAQKPCFSIADVRRLITANKHAQQT